MKLTIQYHLGNPNMCRIPELTIRPMPECEGGGWWMPREQAEQLVSTAVFAQKCSDDGWDRASSAQGQKNLIAAAPDILSALKAMVLNDKHTYRDCHKAALAAIAIEEHRPLQEGRWEVSPHRQSDAECEANARLIAAAPELLAALKDILADCEEYSRINNLHNEDGSPATNHAMRWARDAIAKATT